jgi:hypothetical protein
MTEAPVPPHFRTTPEAFPAGETDGHYEAGFGGGDEKPKNRAVEFSSRRLEFQ